MKRTFSNEFRRPKAHLSPYIMNYIQERNPWTVVWWSAAFPGAGHMILCKFISGGLLMLWEFFINVKAHINEAIFYSMIGEFDLAKATIDTKWFLLYSSVYIFTMWDCYAISIDLNKYSQLADRLDSPIMPFNIGPFELHYLDYRKPWNGAVWSLFTPGLGSLYANRLPTGFFVLICFIVAVYYSNALPAIHLTFGGKTELAGKVLSPQWFLNFPSILLFSVSNSYQDIFFTNKFFKTEQSRYLNDNFQPQGFNMPPKTKGSGFIHFISTFQHSAFLELALSDLEQEGIPKEHIFVTAMDKYSPKYADIDRAHKESASKYELAFLLATIFMLLGGIYGFIWKWGPIIWSLIGLILGAILGIIISLLINKKNWFQKTDSAEVVLIVECENVQSELVERILWRHRALGVSKTGM